MGWALRPIDNLSRTEARPRLKVPFETLEIESTMIESKSLQNKVFDSTSTAVDCDVKHLFKQTQFSKETSMNYNHAITLLQ